MIPVKPESLTLEGALLKNSINAITPNSLKRKNHIPLNKKLYRSTVDTVIILLISKAVGHYTGLDSTGFMALFIFGYLVYKGES